MRLQFIFALLFVLFTRTASGAELDTPAAAQALGKARAAVEAQPDELIVCEAEEFQVA